MALGLIGLDCPTLVLSIHIYVCVLINLYIVAACIDPPYRGSGSCVYWFGLPWHVLTIIQWCKQ